MAVVGCVGCVAWAEETALLLLFRLHLCIQTAQKKNLCPQPMCTQTEKEREREREREREKGETACLLEKNERWERGGAFKADELKDTCTPKHTLAQTKQQQQHCFWQLIC